jgi:quercetin dioxygenase-like cupin family protein
MPGKFVMADEAVRETLDWGVLGWLCNPPVGANQLTVIDAEMIPGGGHNFHKHPDQEEVLVVIAGEIEQWLDQEKRTLKAGDSVFIPADLVHASFNVSGENAHFLAILGPCVGPIGYELVDMADEEPWKSLR